MYHLRADLLGSRQPRGVVDGWVVESRLAQQTKDKHTMSSDFLILTSVPLRACQSAEADVANH